MQQRSVILPLIFFTIFLSACGKKGPLYLPPEPEAMVMQQAVS